MLFAKSKRDLQFVYGASKSNVSQVSISTENQEPRKTYRERIGLKPMGDERREEICKSNETFRKQLKEIGKPSIKTFLSPLLLPKREETRKIYRERIGLKPMSDERRKEICNSNEAFRKQLKEIGKQPTIKTYLSPLPLPKSEEPQKTLRERIKLKPMSDERHEEIRKSNEAFRKQLKEIEKQPTIKKFLSPLPLSKSEEPRKIYKERIGLKPMSNEKRAEIEKANIEFRNKTLKLKPMIFSEKDSINVQKKNNPSLRLFTPKRLTENYETVQQEKRRQLQKQISQRQSIQPQEQKRVALSTQQQARSKVPQRTQLPAQRSQPQAQQRTHPKVQQRDQPQVLQAQPKLQQRDKPQVQQRIQPQAQHRIQSQAQHRIQSQSQHRIQPQAQHRIQPQAQHRIQPQAQHRIQSQAQHRIQSQAQVKHRTLPLLQQRKQPQIHRQIQQRVQPQIQQRSHQAQQAQRSHQAQQAQRSQQAQQAQRSHQAQQAQRSQQAQQALRAQQAQQALRAQQAQQALRAQQA
ncbi:MAG: hypothetical protein H0U57_09245, partial [Tatlockia sp.]|nr:hypothetical protein [Tatlockia sp.]